MKLFRLVICVAFSVMLSIPIGSAFAEQVEFGAVRVDFQMSGQGSDKLAKSKSSARKYMLKGAKKYKLDLTSKQKSRLSKLRKSLSNVKSIDSVKAKCRAASAIFKKANKLHKKKSALIKRFGVRYDEWVGYMTDYQKGRYDELTAKTRKARSSERVSVLKARFARLFDQVALMPYVNSDGWSSKHVSFVSDWGKRNNDFLAGTPMAGLGYYIAAAAWSYDIDPRLYSAIANVESGCGVAPYGSPYNCCGWVWNPPYMSSYEDGIDKWHDFFAGWWKGDWHPIDSMHGYGAYGPWYVNVEMEKI